MTVEAAVPGRVSVLPRVAVCPQSTCKFRGRGLTGGIFGINIGQTVPSMPRFPAFAARRGIYQLSEGHRSVAVYSTWCVHCDTLPLRRQAGHSQVAKSSVAWFTDLSITASQACSSIATVFLSVLSPFAQKSVMIDALRLHTSFIHNSRIIGEMTVSEPVCKSRTCATGWQGIYDTPWYSSGIVSPTRCRCRTSTTSRLYHLVIDFI
jgi:hypothetical protein